MNNALNVLFVSDPNLGPGGRMIVEGVFRNTRTLLWQRGDVEGKATIRNTIESARWDLLISFYNDFVFSQQHLDKATIALNIHPALPLLRGLGYDTLPLIYQHDEYGVTLHFMTGTIDAGKIIKVATRKLSANMVHSGLRIATQRLCLTTLEWLCQKISHCEFAAEAREVLENESRLHNNTWSVRYMTRSSHQELINRMKREDPHHRVFR